MGTRRAPLQFGDPARKRGEGSRAGRYKARKLATVAKSDFVTPTAGNSDSCVTQLWQDAAEPIEESLRWLVAPSCGKLD